MLNGDIRPFSPHHHRRMNWNSVCFHHLTPNKVNYFDIVPRTNLEPNRFDYFNNVPGTVQR